ncbi:MAG: hypothetical protein ABL949_16855 [Fimbriimonadaceae bacterium]
MRKRRWWILGGTGVLILALIALGRSRPPEFPRILHGFEGKTTLLGRTASMRPPPSTATAGTWVHIDFYIVNAPGEVVMASIKSERAQSLLAIDPHFAHFANGPLIISLRPIIHLGARATEVTIQTPFSPTAFDNWLISRWPKLSGARFGRPNFPEYEPDKFRL